LANNETPQPVLAGIAWWQWASIYQLYRGLPACQDGVLSDGLVDQNRNRLPMYEQMTGFFDAIDEKVAGKYELWLDSALGIEYEGKAYQPVCLKDARAGQGEAWDAVLRNPRRSLQFYADRPFSDTGAVCPEPVKQIGSIPVDIAAGAPLVLGKTVPSISVKVGLKTKRLHFFGHTTYCEGYPYYGTFGKSVARYRLCYSDGSETEIDLRNGIDLASSSMLSVCSRINPVAAKTRRIAKMIPDPDWEHYQILYESFDADYFRILDSVVFELTDMEETVLLYGITAELA
jgi:hypothetical protein